MFGYDSRGRLISQQDGVTGGSAATFGYDANGNLLTHVEGTKTITRAFDNLNRISSYSYADTANPSHNYTLGYLLQLIPTGSTACGPGITIPTFGGS